MPGHPSEASCNSPHRHPDPGSIPSAGSLLAADKSKKLEDTSPLDRYIREAAGRQTPGNPQKPAGSLWSPTSRLTDLGSDIRAAQVDDLITVLVSESASAIAQGTTKTQRQSSLSSTVGALAGPKNPKSALANLANVNTQAQLNGEGATSRSTQLNTTLSARVTQVLPNGYLVVEGTKDVVVNSERQVVTVRGIVRPMDLTTDNIVTSAHIAQMEVTIKGKGVCRGRSTQALHSLPPAHGPASLLNSMKNLTAACLLLILPLAKADGAVTRLKELVSLAGVRDNQADGLRPGRRLGRHRGPAPDGIFGPESDQPSGAHGSYRFLRPRYR